MVLIYSTFVMVMTYDLWVMANELVVNELERIL